MTTSARARADALQSASARRLPQSHLDLLERPLLAALTTRMPDGSLQTQPVWSDYDGSRVRFNTMRGFRKEQNMRADPRVAVLIVDPDRPGRWMEIRGRVELDEAEALAHLNGLARRYTGASRYFGGCVRAVLAEREVPVLVRLIQTRVVTGTVANSTLATARTRRPRTTGAECRGSIAAVPADHLDLLQRPHPAVLSTSMRDGQPQTQSVWSDFDGSHLRIARARERQKVRNLGRDPHATALIVDPADGGRWIEIRGLAELSEPAAHETRVICRIHPLRIVCDAIHRPAKQGGVT